MATITTKTIYPGNPGSIKETNLYGDKLVCIRYKYDVEKQTNIKTIEIVTEINKVKKSHRIPYNKVVFVKIGYNEKHLRRIVKSAGGVWKPGKKLWQMRYGDVKNLGLTERIHD
jgi:hypothetical protein